MLTVRNRSNDLVMVGDSYIFSGAVAALPDAIARAAVANHPGALSIVEDAPPGQPEPVAPPTQGKKTRRKAAHSEAE